MFQTLMKYLLEFVEKEFLKDRPDLEEVVLKEMTDLLNEIADFLEKKLEAAKKD